MAARKPELGMRPAVTVLQLDTAFPRVPGDVACPATYRGDVEILRVPCATVGAIVTDAPDAIDIAPFETALARAQGDVVVTSCGFLSPWQDHLAGLCARPLVSSALIGLATLAQDHAPGEVMIVTFDAASLTAVHLGAQAAHLPSVLGLPPDHHLRRVIQRDLPDLDAVRAGREIVELVRAHLTPIHRAILLECTNLPPYASALRAATGLPVTDVLTVIEDLRPGTIAAPFLA